MVERIAFASWTGRECKEFWQGFWRGISDSGKNSKGTHNKTESRHPGLQLEHTHGIVKEVSVNVCTTAMHRGLSI